MHARAAPCALWRSLGRGAKRMAAPALGVGLRGGERACLLQLQPSFAAAAAAARMSAYCAATKRSLSSAPAPASAQTPLVVAPNVPPPGIVRSLKEELWRRQKVATTFFTHPVGLLEDTNSEAGTIELAAAVFQHAERLDILNRVVLWQRAKKRVICRPAKNRAMTQGGGRKPWRQKGSGRARHGSIRSPIWKGGGKAHGPVPRFFAFSLNKKVRRMGLRVALSARMREGKCFIIQSEALKERKTQYLKKLLDKWGWDNVLFIGGCELEENFRLAASNIPNCDVLPAMGANVYSILKRRQLVLTTEAVELLHAHLLRTRPPGPNNLRTLPP